MPFKRKTKDGHVYYVDLTPKGYPHRITKTCGRAARKRDARRMEDTLTELAQAGHWHEHLDALRAGKFSLPDLHAARVANRLDDLLRPLKDPLLADALRDIRYHPRYEWAAEKLQKLAGPHARVNWLARKENLQKIADHYADNYKPNTEQREWGLINIVLRRYYGDERRKKLLDEVQRRTKPESRDTYLESEEIARVEEVSGDWWLMIELALASGLRQGEQLALKVKDIDFTKPAVRVRKGKTKAARRRVPLFGRVIADLRAWVASQGLQPDDPLFPGVKDKQLRVAWKRICEAAGIARHITWNDLRHTYGVHCAEAGVPLTTLKFWMGHEKIKTTAEVYAVYCPDEQSVRHEAAMVGMGLGTYTAPTPGPTLVETDAASVVFEEDKLAEALLGHGARLIPG